MPEDPVAPNDEHLCERTEDGTTLTCAAAVWTALRGPAIVWEATNRASDAEPWEASDRLGLFATRAAAQAKCVDYARIDSPLEWHVDVRPGGREVHYSICEQIRYEVTPRTVHS